MKKKERSFDLRLNLFGKEDFYLHMRPMTGKILAVINGMICLSFFVTSSFSLFNHKNDQYKTFKAINDFSNATLFTTQLENQKGKTNTID